MSQNLINKVKQKIKFKDHYLKYAKEISWDDFKKDYLEDWLASASKSWPEMNDISKLKEIYKKKPSYFVEWINLVDTQRIIESPDSDAKIELAKKTKDQKILKLLMRDSDEKVRLEAISHIDEDNLEMFSRDKSSNVLYEIIRRTKDPELLDYLSTTFDRTLIRKIASHPHTSKKTLIRLLKYQDRFDILEEILSNKNCPENVEKYIHDMDFKTKMKIAPDAGGEAAKILSKDKNWQIRQEVASSKNAPKEVIKQLLKDDHYGVREKAEINLKIEPKKNKRSNIISKIKLILSK